MPDMQQQSQPALQASSRVLDVPELLEKILLGDRPLQIVRCQRVCRGWKACIENSLRLQRKIFMRAEHVTRVWEIQSAVSRDGKYEGILQYTHPEGLHAKTGIAVLIGDYRILPLNWHLMPEQRCLTATRHRVERFDDSTLWPHHVIPVQLNPSALAHPAERTPVRGIGVHTLRPTFSQPVTFTIHRRGSTALSWRWMLLSNPPCKSVTIHPFPARFYDLELGALLVQGEKGRSNESMTIYNESGVRVRDVMRALGTCRKVLRPGMSFKLLLNGVICPTKADCIVVKAASAKQRKSFKRLMGLSPVDDTQEGLSMDGTCPRLDEGNLESAS